MYPRVLVIYVRRVSEEEPMDVHIFNFIYHVIVSRKDSVVKSDASVCIHVYWLYMCGVSRKKSLWMCIYSTLSIIAYPHCICVTCLTTAYRCAHIQLYVSLCIDVYWLCICDVFHSSLWMCIYSILFVIMYTRVLVMYV